VKFEDKARKEGNALPLAHKPEMRSSPHATAGSLHDKEHLQNTGYATDSSAIEVDTPTADTDILTLRMRPTDGSIMKMVSYVTEYEIVSLRGKVIVGGRRRYWTQWAPTLEPEENLPPELVAKFEARQKLKAMARPREQKRRGRPRKQIDLGGQLRKGMVQDKAQSA
jgi:hypothetical protein